MTGWLVNDKLTCIPGTRTFWHHLLDGVPGLVDKTIGTYEGLAGHVESEAVTAEPDYIIRNAAYFRWINVGCPVISFVQDIVEGALRDQLIEACAASRSVVFNSEYTKMMYPELHATDCRVIPIGTDETIFRPRISDPYIPDDAVLWVGSGHRVKGFDLACRLASESERPWVFVMKDDTQVEVGALVLRRISQEQLARVASACSVGVCTSTRETQHLAGIEMGMCGLPLVTTEVGAYYSRPIGPWGQVSNGHWHDEIEMASKLNRAHAALYWRKAGFGLPECIDKWRDAIAMMEFAHAR